MLRPKKLLAGVLALAAFAQAGDYSTWARYRNVTVNTSALTLGAPVTKIPLLVRFNATEHKDMLDSAATQILAAGADIRVTKADGTTDVPFEIEHAVTGASGGLTLWILADSVAQSSATAASFRVYWGKAAATTLSNPQAVFDTANGFLGVWHMNETVAAAGDTIRDATPGKNHAVLGLMGTGAVPTNVTTAIGIGKNIGGTSDANGAYFQAIDPDSSLSVQTEIGQYTVSGWVNVTTCASNARSAIISKYMNNNTAGTRQFALQINGGAANWNLTNNPPSLAASGTNEFNAHTPCAANEWQYVVGTYKSEATPLNTVDGVAATMKIYVNGGGAQTNATFNQANTASVGRGSQLRISGIGEGARTVRGALDEVRISKVARDSNFVRLEYATQRPTGGTAVAVGAAQTQSAPTNNYTAWSATRDIVLNTSATGANVTDTVTNFPVLIRLGAAEAAIIGAANDGNSIRFSKVDNITALPYEIEHWSPTSAAIWVKVDSILGNNAAQKIRMHYGNGAAASESNGGNVFNAANGYVGHWNLGNAAGAAPRPSSVTGAPAAQVRNALPPVSGIIGMADTLAPNGAPNSSSPLGRYIEFGRDENFANVNYAGFSDFSTGFSYSGWFMPTSAIQFWRALVMSPDSAGNVAPSVNRTLIMGNRNNDGQISFRWHGSDYNSGAGVFVVNEWRHVALSKAPGTNGVQIYVNGALFATSSNAGDLPNIVRNGVWIGRSGISTDGYFSGKVDNISMGNRPRTAAWVKLSYANQITANLLADIGLPSVASAPGVPTSVAATAGNASAVVTWTAPVSNGGAAITGYTVTSTPGGFTCTSVTSPCTVNGLANGTGYTFAATATNSAGTSSPSAASASVTPTPFPGWTAGRSITLNTTATGANVTGTVRNFPVLIRLGAAESAILSAAKSAGEDIRFLNADSATIIPHQIESWSSTAATIWVKVDSVLGNNNTQKIHMIWGNPGATTTSNGPAVFDTLNGFAAVWHLNEASGNVADATGKGNAGIPSATPPTHNAASLLGAGKTFVPNGANSNWYQIGTDRTALNLNTNGPITISAWVNPTSCDERIAVISKYVNGATPAGRQYALHTGNTSSNWRFTVGPAALAGSGSTEFFADAEGACVTGAWKHVVGTFASAGTPTIDSAVNVNIYVDGAFMGAGSSVGIAGVGDSALAFIGRISNDQRYMNGSLDEITVSTVRRDSNWIKLSYQSQKLMQAFTNIGVTLPSVPSAPQALSGFGGSAVGSVVLSWSAPANDGGAAVSGYTVTGVPGGTCTTAQLTCTITGLTAGGTYTFTVTATNSAGTSAASASSGNVIVTGLALPGSFVIRMDGARTPYTYRLPTNAIAITDKLSMSITDAQGKTVWSSTINPAASKVGEMTWNGKNAKGAPVAPGMYIVRLRAVMDGQVIEAVQRGVKL